MVTTKNRETGSSDLGKPNGRPSNADLRLEELMAALELLQNQNTNQERRNKEQLLCSQALEASEVQLQQQLTDMGEVHAGV